MQQKQKLGRRVKRFVGKRKFSRLNKKLQKFQKYSLICFVGNSVQMTHLTGEEKPTELIILCFQEFTRLAGFVFKFLIKYSKKLGKFILSIAMRNRYIIVFTALTGCAVLLLHQLALRFGKKLKWYNYLLVLLLLLAILCLLAAAIKAEAFKTVFDWVNSILISIFLWLQNINSLLDKYSRSESAVMMEENPEVPKLRNSEFKTFAFFSVLTVIMTRYLLVRFKREVVGESPFTEVIIKIIDNDRFFTSVVK